MSDIDEVVHSSQNYCEHSNRTKIICNDIVFALADTGCNVNELYDYHIDGCNEPVAPGQFSDECWNIFDYTIILLYV